MPTKPKRPCRYPGCPGFCEQGQVFCKDHMAWSGDRLRGGADARGAGGGLPAERTLRALLQVALPRRVGAGSRHGAGPARLFV